MKKVIRLTEGDLHRIVEESVNKILMEVDGYNNTMKKFDQNTMSGKFRRLFNPKKYKQYQKLKQQGDMMGADATKRINNTHNKMGDIINGEYSEPNYDKYYRMTRKYFSPHSNYQGEGSSAFRQDFDNDFKHIEKYGTGGQTLRPLGRTRNGKEY
jgi:hypothetical protein